MEEICGQNGAHRNIRHIRLLVSIVARGRGERIIAVCNGICRAFHLSFMGKGTAKSELLDYLGLGETDKDIVLSVIRADCLPDVKRALKEEVDFDRPGHGIAFTVPITSVGGPKTLRFISGAYGQMIEEYQKGGEQNGGGQ